MSGGEMTVFEVKKTSPTCETKKKKKKNLHASEECKKKKKKKTSPNNSPNPNFHASLEIKWCAPKYIPAWLTWCCMWAPLSFNWKERKKWPSVGFSFVYMLEIVLVTIFFQRGEGQKWRCVLVWGALEPFVGLSKGEGVDLASLVILGGQTPQPPVDHTEPKQICSLLTAWKERQNDPVSEWRILLYKYVGFYTNVG